MIDVEEIVRFSERTIKYLENDKASFESVLSSPNLIGKLGFAMIATAMAAFDTYAWLLFQRFDLRKSSKDLFFELLRDSRFFDKKKYLDEHTFYASIRCGVVHQLYPKDAIIIADSTPVILYQHQGKLCINAYALYCDVLDGISKVHSYIAGLPADEKFDLSTKLLLRSKMDAE